MLCKLCIWANGSKSFMYYNWVEKWFSGKQLILHTNFSEKTTVLVKVNTKTKNDRQFKYVYETLSVTEGCEMLKKCYTLKFEFLII